MDTKKGRPPISKERKRITLILPLDDYELLQSICSVSGSRPATMIRELINNLRPHLKAMDKSLQAAQMGDSDAALSTISKSLGKTLEDGKKLQRDMFNGD